MIHANPVVPGLVAVVVLCYNELKWLDRCLTSVLATEDDNYRVYLVDNGSSDGSAEFVLQNFPSVTVVSNGKNLGFAGGNNEGIIQAINDGAEFIFLLNPDTWVEPTWLKEIRAVYHSDPTLSVVTAMIKNYEDDNFDQNFLQILNVTPNFLQDLWNQDVKAWYLTDTGSGAALMATREFYLTVGLIDPEFFIYFEEIDLLRRGRFHSKRIAVSTKGIIHHYNRLETPNSGRPVKIRFERGFIIYTLKDQFNPTIKCLIKFLVEIISRPLGAMLKSQWKRTRQLLRVGLELALKSPWILRRRHLEMRYPELLPEMKRLPKS